VTEQVDVEFLHRLADLADEITSAGFRGPLEVATKVKHGFSFDPVTDADRDAELAIRALLAERYPNHGVLGEEFGLSGEGRFQWVIDPIDGTRPFLCGIPVWGTPHRLAGGRRRHPRVDEPALHR